MNILWRKFPDEALAGKRFTADGKQRLEAVFANHVLSPWGRALTRLNLTAPQEPMLRWHDDMPYLNWSAFIALISGDAMSVTRADHGYTITAHTTFRSVWKLIKIQWAISRYVRAPLKSADLVESLALGLVLQSLLIHLGPQGANLATLMAAPDKAPASTRKTLNDIQAIQLRRTQISHVWNDVLAQDGDDPATAPEFFWDDTPIPTDAPTGQSVCAGTMTGIAIAIHSKTTPEDIQAIKTRYNAPAILVFRYAKPDTTLLFPHADALVFCEGGVLSHACTVARESNIPAITNMGAAFFESVDNKWLVLDGAAGTAKIL